MGIALKYAGLKQHLHFYLEQQESGKRGDKI